MRELPRRALIISVIFAISNVVRWEMISGAKLSTKATAKVNNNLEPPQPRPQRKKVKVFQVGPQLPVPANSSFTILVPAERSERHDAAVIWSTYAKAITDTLSLAIESMYIRLQRIGKVKLNADTKPDTEQMKAILSNFTRAELNAIDPDWQIFLLDISDGGMGIWPYWYMEHEMTPVVGWKRINYATRSAQNDKYMDSWIEKMTSERMPTMTFDGFVGTPINFTAMDVDEDRGAILGKGCRSIQRLFMYVREDIVTAIDDYMKDNHQSAYEGALSNNNDEDVTIVEDTTTYLLSPAIARLSRPMDVRTFWNATVCNLHCSFRNRISETIATLPQRHPNVNIQTNTDVVGFIHNKGRNDVHPDFIRGMLTTKIIVLAQRDRWEDHSRFYEALLSGALVLSDPYVYYPYGTIDGENIVVYNSWTDLELKILYYLDPRNEEERIRIGQKGREVALTRHRAWQQGERLFLNDMEYRNEYGLSNKPWLRD